MKCHGDYEEKKMIFSYSSYWRKKWQIPESIVNIAIDIIKQIYKLNRDKQYYYFILIFLNTKITFPVI